jgi:hypothetical protein
LTAGRWRGACPCVSGVPPRSRPYPAQGASRHARRKWGRHSCLRRHLMPPLQSATSQNHQYTCPANPSHLCVRCPCQARKMTGDQSGNMHFGYTDPEPGGRQGHAGERPERRTRRPGWGCRWSHTASSTPSHPGSKALNAGVRGRAPEIQDPAAPPHLVLSRPRCSAASLRRSVIYPPSQGHEHRFVPGFAITATASRARLTRRAYPFVDEDIEAGAGSRYGSCLVSIHQLASAR